MKKELSLVLISLHMLVSPSILSADFRILQKQIEECEKNGATAFHLDVMDGHFVPNITIGPEIVKAIRKSTELTLEAHLMIDRPDKYYKIFADAGSDILLIHYESPVNISGLFGKMKEEGIRYGIVINPDTEFSAVSDLIEGSEILLIMSVYPGFSGQKFIDVTGKVSEASSYIKEHGLKTRIEVDGGINNETGKIVADAGADIVVSGSYVFSGNIREKIESLKAL